MFCFYCCQQHWLEQQQQLANVPLVTRPSSTLYEKDWVVGWVIGWLMGLQNWAITFVLLRKMAPSNLYRPDSIAQQSKAEQSKAEQSWAEHIKTILNSRTSNATAIQIKNVPSIGQPPTAGLKRILRIRHIHTYIYLTGWQGGVGRVKYRSHH